MNKARKTIKENKRSMSFLIENELEKAELVLAAKSITDKLQDMAETLAKIEAGEIMPMQDQLKMSFGDNVAKQFATVATNKIRDLVSAVSDAKDGIGSEINRLEKAVNGESTNDMAMDDMSDESDLPGNDMSDGMPDDGMPDDDDADVDAKLPDFDTDEKPMNAAGRAKKESFQRRGRALSERIDSNSLTSNSYDSNLNNLHGFDGRIGSLAHGIHDLIENSDLKQDERRSLFSVLSHLAAFASDAAHWEDADAKLETTLQGVNLYTQTPEVRVIVQKMKKLVHMISFKHEGILEAKKAKNDPCWKNYKQIGMKKKGNKTVPNCVPESKNLDESIVRAFRQALTENKNTMRSIKIVSEKFSVDPSDVVAIIREAAKKTKVVKVSKEAKVVRPLVVARKGNKTPKKSVAETTTWYDIVSEDTGRIVEQQPVAPLSPSESRAKNDAQIAADKAKQSGQPAPVTPVPATAKPNPNANPNLPKQNAGSGQDDAQPGMAPKLPGSVIKNVPKTNVDAAVADFMKQSAVKPKA